MIPDIRTPRAKSQDTTPLPPRPRTSGRIPLALGLGVLGAITGGLLAPALFETAATRTVALQALLAHQGHDPRLIFAANTPFGARADAALSPFALDLIHTLMAHIGHHGLRLLAALGGAMLGIGLFALSWMAGSPLGKHRGLMAAIGATAGVFLVAGALSSAALSPLWGVHAGAIGLAALAGAGAIAPIRTGRIGAGLLAGLALALSPHALPLALMAGAAATHTHRLNARKMATLGLGLGGAIAPLGGHPSGALALWGLATLGLALGLLPQRLKPRRGGALLLAAGAAMATLISTGTAPIIALWTPPLPALVMAAITLAGLGMAGILISRRFSWRGWAPHGVWVLTLSALPVALCAGLHWVGPVAAIAALSVHMAAISGVARAGLLIPVLIGALGVGTAAPAVFRPLALDMHTGPHANAMQTCTADALTSMTAALRDINSSRVLAMPMVGWHLLAEQHSVSVVGAGLTDNPAQDTDANGDADAIIALSDTSPDGATARRIVERRSVDTIALCAEPEDPQSLAGRLWRGNSADVAAMSSWLIPAKETDTVVIYTVVRNR